MKSTSFPLRRLTVLACAASALLAGAPVTAATLQGRVVNGTTGAAGVADRIELIDVAQGMAPIATAENVEGTFEFAEVPDVSAAHLLLRVSYGGIVSSQSLSQLDAPVEVKVYESTTSLESVKVARHHALFQRDGDHMVVTEWVEFDNLSDPPVAIVAESLPMRLWMGNPMHGEPTASVGTSQMPVTVPLVRAPDDAQVMGVQQALPPGRSRMLVRYNFEYHDGQGTWQTLALFDTEDRRALVSPTDVQVSVDQMVAIESPLEGFAAWSGLPIEAGARWSVGLAGGTAVASDGHNHPVQQGAQAITEIAVRQNRMSENPVLLMLGLGAALTLIMLLGLARTPAPALAETKEASYEDDKRRRISRLADRYISGEITREQFERDRDAILGGKHGGHNPSNGAHRVETATH